ncbi:MAG: biopolymer transporter ExbD [Archangium sp.]|nr:biopolymer transporter ExbD [Archangium sp.]MDP3157137.1 biopolymer transporter ExbD [Archangium sp.]MDP3575854.1 biopolymer transporter ExbD [Archangium sp.]
MGMAVGGKKGIKAEINVTPMVDVVLVLLIIFMVITPMLQRGKDVQLPKAVKVDDEKKGGADPIVVSVTPDKTIYIESDSYDDEGFQVELQKKLISNPNQRILLKGDQSLVFEDVRRVMNLARKSGAKSIALGVEEVKK